MREEAIVLGRARASGSLKSLMELRTKNLILGSSLIPEDEDTGLRFFFLMVPECRMGIEIKQNMSRPSSNFQW